MGAFGTVAAVTALPAFASVTSNAYTIGTPSGAVTSLTVSPTTALSGTTSGYTLTFISPGSVASGGTITIGDSAGNTVVDTALNLGGTNNGVTVVSGSCLQSGGATTSTKNPLVITLNSTSCAAGIAAGATVSVGFSATNPSANFNFTVSTSSNATATNAPTVTVSSSPPTVSAASLSLGVNTTYTLTNVGATTASKQSWSSLTSTAGVLQVTASSPLLTFSNSGPASYSVTYTPSGGTATTDVVTAVAGGGTNSVQLTLTTAIASGGVVNITALGTNPASSSAGNVSMTITPGNFVSGVFTASGTPLTTSNSLAFGTGVSAVTLAISPLVSAASATYTLTFKATSAVAIGGTISLTETAGPTSFTSISGVLVSDATQNWRFVTTTPGSSSGLTITLPNAIVAGDAITVTVAGVTNPGAGTYTDFTVSTSADTVPVSAPAYTISASGTAGVTVVPNPNTVGSLATYTITGLFATSAITGGTTGSPANNITLTAPAGTVFPNSASSYVITDATTATGSGTVASIIWNTPGASVTIVPGNSIVSGDALTITISDVINPSTSSSAYTIGITGPVNGQSGVAPFPRANSSLPNGALINFAGTIYVFAGGHGFGIPTPTVLNKIRAVDPAVPLNAVAGAVPPTAGARSGTLISTYAVNGNATIYVVGTDGDVHGFSTPKQLISYGYDTRINVTTNTLGGMTVGSTEGQLGAAKGNAYATASDGAIIDSSGTYFTFVGGRAFGIPTPARLAQITGFYTHNGRAVPTVLTGTISTTQTGAAVASGVLPSVSPAPTSSVTNATVYVTFVGNVFPFKTQNQLKNDGYSGTAAVPAVNTGGLPVVLTYTSS
jgi:hypothetical protein